MRRSAVERHRDLGELAARRLDRLFEPLPVAIHRGELTAARTSVDQPADVLGRAADPVGQRADLVGRERRSAAELAGARCSCRVDGQDVGLLAARWMISRMPPICCDFLPSLDHVPEMTSTDS